MGALALPIPWIPEDDLLLKNAIEAGASLESLAKGAVQFSRRYTIKELQDRWLALLYDPIISARAAEQMVELERSAAQLPSKSNRGDSSKVNKNAHGKRKAESVRRCYYALRKRVCNEPINPSDLNFLGDNCFMGTGAPAPDNMLGDPLAGHFGVEGAEFDDFFPPVMRDPSCAVSEFPVDQHNTFEDHMEQNTSLPDNMAIKELPSNNMFEGNGIPANPGCSGKTIFYSEFEGDTMFNPSISDCDNSLQHLHYASPPPAMSDWKTPEGIAVTKMPDDISIRGDDVQTRDPFAIPDDGDAGGTSEYDVMHAEADLKNSASCSQGFFDALSESLLNFGCDDELMLNGDDDVKGNGKTYFDDFSLLLDSPNDTSEDKLPNMLEAREPDAAEVYMDIPSTVIEENNSVGDPHLGDSNVQNSSDSQMPTSAACVNSEFPEYRDGVIFCTLNTEDPEIPCNDDVVFPSKQRPASLNRRTQSETNNPSLHGKDFARTQSSGKGQTMIKKVTKRSGESYLPSQPHGPDAGLNCAVDEFGVKFETSRAETSVGPRISCQSIQAVKKEPLELPLARHSGCSVADQPGQVADLGHLPPAGGGTNVEAQTSAFRNQELHAPSAEYIATEPGGEPLLSDPEEHFSESDADVPYFSDVESMILDMDLGPEDQDFFCSKEVAKYQREDVKRAIIRLEQNAHSYMQRAIASHGAFAILYGRHSKHYIKKPEVMLGRAAEDYAVDIDLGREGRANKISRKQAIIKMGEDGAFYIQNFAKKPIYVNNREVGSNQSLALLSNCLIEIRGMPFIFETNQACVKQYLNRKLEEKRLNV